MRTKSNEDKKDITERQTTIRTNVVKEAAWVEGNPPLVSQL